MSSMSFVAEWLLVRRRAAGVGVWVVWVCGFGSGSPCKLALRSGNKKDKRDSRAMSEPRSIFVFAGSVDLNLSCYVSRRVAMSHAAERAGAFFFASYSFRRTLPAFWQEVESLLWKMA